MQETVQNKLIRLAVSAGHGVLAVFIQKLNLRVLGAELCPLIVDTLI
jgi:hypothetical protein